MSEMCHLFFNTTFRAENKRSILLIFNCLFLFFCAYGKLSSAVADVQLAFTENAEASFSFNLAEINQSVFYQTIEPHLKNTELLRSLKIPLVEKSLGISNDDWQQLALSVKNIEPFLNDQAERAHFIAAVSIRKVLTEKDLEKLFATIAGKGAGERFLKTTYKSCHIYVDTFVKVPSSRAVALLSGSPSILIFGDKESVRQGVERALSGKYATASTTKWAKAFGYDTSHGWGIVHLSAKVRERIKQSVVEPQLTLLLGPSAPALASCSKVGLSINCSDSVAIQLYSMLDTKEDALSVKTILENLTGGIGKMLSFQLYGKVLNVLNKAKTHTEGTNVRLSSTLTVEDAITILNSNTANQTR